MIITRENFEELLDKGNLFAAMHNGRWWKMRRNGATQRWKRDANRIRVPFKVGFKECGAIDETWFIRETGQVRADLMRHKDDVPSQYR